MDLVAVDRRASPRESARVRLVGTVRRDSAPGEVTEVWFEVPGRLDSCLSTSGNPWLACLLPLAARLHEPLRLCAPVDERLLAGARTLLHIWRNWYPDRMHVVPIEAPVSGTRAAGTRTGAFFSGGVDSFFTTLEDGRSPAAAQARIDDLITLWGFDIPVDDAAAFLRLRDALARAADALGKDLVDVAMNVRGVPAYPWELAHCGALAAAGLALEGALATVFIPSTHGYQRLDPGGSHPLTDPLFSTSGTAIVHHGAECTRAEKVARIVTSPVALQTLRVCAFQTERNCGRCRKCYCTMLHLHVLDCLHRCPTFPAADFTVQHAETVDSTSFEVRLYLEEVRALAQAKQQLDVVRAIDRGFHRTTARNRRRRLWRFARERLGFA